MFPASAPARRCIDAAEISPGSRPSIHAAGMASMPRCAPDSASVIATIAVALPPSRSAAAAASAKLAA